MRKCLICFGILALLCIVVSIVSPYAIITQSGKGYVSNIHDILSSDLSVQKSDLVCLGFNLSSRREPWIIFEYLPTEREVIEVKFKKAQTGWQHQDLQRQLQSVAESCEVSLMISRDSEIGSFRTKSYTVFRVVNDMRCFLFYAGGL